MNRISPTDTPTQAEIEAYLAKPIKHTTGAYPLDVMTPGYQGKHISFDWRPYEERTKEAREDFDRLVVSIYHHGLLKPLIVHTAETGVHVLIGQRRWEIARRLGIESARVVDILEDVSLWWRYDVQRLNRPQKAEEKASE